MTAMARAVFREQKDPRGFTRIEEPLEAHRYLGRAIETLAKVDILLPESGVRFSSVILESSSLREGIRIAVPDYLSEEQRQGPITNAMMVVFLRGQVLLCVQAKKVEWQEEVLLIHPDWTVFKLQRRKEPRFEIPAAYELTVTMSAVDGGPSQRVKKRVLDISTSGMAFHVLSPREAVYFKKGLFLKKLCLIIEGRQIFLDARVASILELPKSSRLGGFKVGVEFIRIGPVDSRHISSYVVRNLAQLYLD